MIESLVGAALWAILVSCLFGAALFTVVAVVVRVNALDAAIRHGLWTLALCTTALMPLVALTVGIAHARSATIRVETAAQRAASPVTDAELSRGDGEVSRSDVRDTEVPDTRADRRWTPQHAWQPRPDRTLALLITGIWLAGAVIGLAGIGRGIIRIRGLKRRSRPLDAGLAGELPWLTQNRATEREIYLRLSYEIETPVAVGFRRPTILIPTELATQGGLIAIEGLILHEHAHLRRRDDWTNLLQRVIERIFWFNPLVWLLGRRIALDREIAADDAVVAATGAPEAYARSLWQLAREMRMPEHTVVAPGALSTRKQISVRIEALLERRPVRAQWRAAASLVTGVAAISCTFAAAIAAPSVALPLLTPATGADPLVSANVVAPSRMAPIRSTLAHHDPQARTAAAPGAEPAAALRRRIKTPVRVSVAPGDAASMPRLNVHVAPVNVHIPPVNVHVPPVAVSVTQQSAKIARSANVEVAPAAALAPMVANVAIAKVAQASSSSCDDCDHQHDAAARLHHNDLSGADLRGVDWHGRTVENVNLSGANLAGARLDNMHFIGADLSGANLTGASLRDTVISNSNIEGATLKDAHMTGLRLFNVALDGMDLRGLDVRSIFASCAACSMSGADLRGADLHGLRIAGNNLSGADLHGANLNGSRFLGVNLSGADLGSADFRGATFTGCDLEGVDLHGAARAGARFAPVMPTFDDN